MAGDGGQVLLQCSEPLCVNGTRRPRLGWAVGACLCSNRSNHSHTDPHPASHRLITCCAMSIVFVPGASCKESWLGGVHPFTLTLHRHHGHCTNPSVHGDTVQLMANGLCAEMERSGCQLAQTALLISSSNALMYNCLKHLQAGDRCVS